MNISAAAAPAPDGRTKPDIVGVDCGASVTYQVRTRSWDNDQQCWFPGTSQSSPHVAGLAALVKQAYPGYGPAQIAAFLKNNAVERGTAGPDNTWGHGFAQLPSAPLEPAAPCLNGAYPCNLAVTAGDGQVDLSWTNDPTHQQHQVYTRNLATSEVSSETLGAVNTHTLTGLDNGTEYRFWVRSRAGGGSWGRWSSPVEATPAVGTTGPTPTPGPGTPTPTPAATCPNDVYPCDVTATPGNGQVTVTWTAHPDHQQHQVYTRNLATSEVDNVELGAVNTHTLTGLDNGTEYRFWVRSRATGGSWGRWSNPVEATPVVGTTGPTPTPGPGTPTPAPTATCPNDVYPCDVTATPGDGQVTVTWTAHPDHQQHQVYTRNLATSEVNNETLGAVSTHTLTGLDNGTEYRFWVRSRADGGSWGRWSNPVNATPVAGAATPTPAPATACSVGLSLAPGQSCAHTAANFIIQVDSSGAASLRFTANSAQVNNLSLTRSGDNWVIGSLP